MIREMIGEVVDGVRRDEGPKSAYCSTGVAALVLPHLFVPTVGQIAFPLLPSQAEALMAIGAQAPFGRGHQTLVDTSVRDCFQLTPAQFTLDDPNFYIAVRAFSQHYLFFTDFCL